MDPLVTVAMPYYDDLVSLPRALASLLTQTYTNWECIIVDDGSTQNPVKVIEGLEDERFRLIRHRSNYGRPVARQTALDHAKGTLLTFLDADDWLFPTKIESQVSMMLLHPEVSVCGHPVAVIDDHANLLGRSGPPRSVETPSFQLDQFAHFRSLNFPYVTAMIEMDKAKQTHYDQSLKRAQDYDFLVRCCFGESYAVIFEPLYAYTGWQRPSLRTSLDSLRFERQVFRRHWSQNRSSAVREYTTSIMKSLGYLIAHASGREGDLYARRVMQPSIEEREAYLQAFNDVSGLSQVVGQL